MVEANPTDILPLSPVRIAGKGIHAPDIKQYTTIGITVGNTDQRPRPQYIDAEFLVQFPAKRRQHVLTGLEFASRKLPQPSLMRVQRTTGYEDTAGRVDDGCSSDMDNGVQERYSALMRT
ncbi:MAG: hypothetical protein Kow0096_02830 [Thiohalomonadaceae bacterium]